MGRVREPHALDRVSGRPLDGVTRCRTTNNSSFPAYVAGTNPSSTEVATAFDDPALGPHSGFSPQLDREIAHLRYVVDTATSVGFDVNNDLRA